MAKCRKAAIPFAAVDSFYPSIFVLASKLFTGFCARPVNPLTRREISRVCRIR
jgi:hypothetical protein